MGHVAEAFGDVDEDREEIAGGQISDHRVAVDGDTDVGGRGHRRCGFRRRLLRASDEQAVRGDDVPGRLFGAGTGTGVVGVGAAKRAAIRRTQLHLRDTDLHAEHAASGVEVHRGNVA